MRCDTSCDTCAFLVSQPKTLVYQHLLHVVTHVTRFLETLLMRVCACVRIILYLLYLALPVTITKR